MAGNMDTRVVELKFENREFERNIAKSTKSVEELKEAMDFDETSKGLEKFSRAFDFGTIESNLQKLTDKFTGFGDAAEYVISRIRRSIESAAYSLENFIKSLSTSQISVGQNKYDQLNKAVNAIVSGGKASEDQAYKTMERVSVYTDQTSHSFETMVQMISNLTSIGYGLQDAELLVEGFGNAATYAGKGASEAAASMSILSRSMNPSGFLGYEKFLSLSQTYGVITDKWREQAIAAAEAVGTLKKKGDKYLVNVKGQKKAEVSASNIEDTLKYRWLTSKVLAELYKNYQFANSGDIEKDMEDLAHPEKALDSFGKTAYLTGQRALTLADAFNAVRESVSSGWMESFRLIFGDVTEAAEHFTNIADRIIAFVERIKGFRNDLLKQIVANGGRQSLMQLLLGDYENDVETGAVGLLDMLDSLADTISKGFWDFILAINPGIMLDEQFSKDKWEQNSEYRMYTLSNMFVGFLDKIRNFFAETQRWLNEEITVNGKVTTRMQMIQNIISGFVGILALAYNIAEHAYEFLTGMAGDLDPSVTAIIDLLSRLGLAIFDTATDTEKAGKFQKFFEDLRTTLQPVTDGINSVVTSFTRLLEVLFGLDEEDKDRSGTFDGIGKALLWIADVFAKIVGPILEFVSRILDAFTMLLEKGITKESVQEFGKQLAEAFKEMFKSFVDNLPDSLSFVKDFIYDLFGLWDPNDETKIKERANTFGTFLHNLFTGQFGGIGEFISSLLGGFNLSTALDTGLGIGSAMNFLQTVANAFKQTNLYTVLLGFLGVATVGGIFALVRRIKKAFETIQIFFDDVGSNLAHGFTGEYEWFGDRILKIVKAIGILVLCIIGLSALPVGKMWSAVGALAVIMGLMLLFFRILSPDTSATAGHLNKNGIRGGSIAQQAAIELMIITIAGAIVAICAALSVLMLAMVPLQKVTKDWGGFARAMLTFLIILGGLGAFIYIMIKAMKEMVRSFGGIGTNKTDFAALGKIAIVMLLLSTVIIAISAAVAILSIALIPFAVMSWGGWGRAMLGLLGVLVLIGGFITAMMTVMNKNMRLYGGGTGNKSDYAALGKIAIVMIVLAGIMIVVAAATALFAIAMIPFAVMSWGGLARAASGLVAVLTFVGAFITIMLGIMKKNMVLYGGGSGNTSDYAALGKIAIVMIVLSGIMIIIAAATAVFAAAMVPFAVMSWGGLARAALGMLAILVLIGGFITAMLSIMKYELAVFGGKGGASDFAALGKIALTLIVLAGAMALIGLAVGVISTAILPLAAIGFDGMINALIGLGAILAIMIGVMTVIRNMKFEGVKLAGFLGFAISVAILMYSLGFVANLNEEQYIRGLIALASIMMMLGIMMAVMNELKPDAKSAGTVILMLVALGVAMILFSIAFNEVKDVKWETIAAFSAGISILLVAIAFAAKLAQGVTIGGILKLALALAAILAVIALMAPMVIGGIATGLSEAAGQLTLMATLLQTFTGKMGGIDEGAMDKAKRIIGSMSELIGIAIGFAFTAGAFTAITQAISQLMIISGELINVTARFNAVTEQSIQHIKTIITRIKGICGNTIKGFAGYLTDAQSFSSVMYELGTGIEILDNHTQNITNPEDSPAIKTIQALAGCANDLDIIAKMNLDDLTSKISGLGGAMILYAEGAKQVKDEMNLAEGEEPDVTAAIALMKSITTGLAEDGGIVLPENMPDETSIGTFGAQIAALAAALIKFEEAGQGLGEGTDKALETLDFFQKLKQKIVDTNFQSNLDAVNIFGSGEEAKGKADELATFGKNIEQLGLSLGQFANSTTYVDEQTGEIKTIDYSNATKALEDIAGVANALPSFGSALEILTGTKEDLTTFAGEIEALGQALNDFHTKTSTMDEVNKTGVEFNYDNAIKALESLAALPGKMPKRGGLASLLEGDEQSLTGWAGDIIALGTGLNEFSKQINGDGTESSTKFDSTAADVAIEAVKKMVKFSNDLSTELPKVGGIGKVLSTLVSGREYTFEDLSNDIGKLGSGLGKLGEGLNTGNWNKDTGVENALNALGSIINVIKKLAELSAAQTAAGNSFSFGFAAMELASFVDYLAVIDSSAISNIVSLMSTISDEFKEYGDIDPNKIEMFKNMAEALAAFATVNPDYDWKVIGKSIDTGIAQGLNDNITIVTDAAKAVAIAAYNAAMKALDANSPSKVFMGVGSYIGLGMAVGIDESTGEVMDAATGMSEKTIETARNMAAIISQIMEEEDLGPTISPVLDLTNLESGASSIGGILGSQYGLTLNGQNLTVTSAAPYDMNMPKDYTDNITKTNDELASLRSDVQELASAMRNIKMVMNTGAVVGAIGPDLDRYLGQRGFYAERTST